MPDEPYMLPDGWTWVAFDEICDVNPKHDPNVTPEGDVVTFVPMGAIDDVTGTIAKPQIRKYGEVRKGYTHFAEGDVLFAKITPCMENGKAAIAKNLVNRIGCGTTELHVLRPLGGILPEYLFNYIRQKSFRRAAEANMTGTAGQLRVPAAYVRNARIPLCPTPEQTRIVAKIEENLQRNRVARTALGKIPIISERFRKSVLTKAFRGELTERDRKDEPASELLKQIAEDRRKRYSAECERAKKEGRRKPRKILLDIVPAVEDSLLVDLPDTWTITKVDFLAYVTKLAGFEYTKYIKLEDKGEVPAVRAQNVQMGRFVEQNTKYISKKTSDLLLRSQLHGREILMVFIGAGTGNVCLAPTDRRWHLGPNVAKIDVDGIDTQYLHLYLQSPIGFANTLSRAKATAQQSLSMQTIREILVAVPPLREQKEIVRRVSDLLAKSKQVEERCQNVDLDKLAQSILNKAFHGELVSQNPNDEAASVLLERIRAERATMTKEGKHRLEEFAHPATITPKA
jgi:type I restriction enzyme S subunit